MRAKNRRSPGELDVEPWLPAEWASLSGYGAQIFPTTADALLQIVVARRS